MNYSIMNCAIFSLLALCAFQSEAFLSGRSRGTTQQLIDALQPVQDKYWNAVKVLKPNLTKSAKIQGIMDTCLKKVRQKNDFDTKYNGVADKCDELYSAVDENHDKKTADRKCAVLTRKLANEEQANVNGAVPCVSNCLKPKANCQ